MVSVYKEEKVDRHTDRQTDSLTYTAANEMKPGEPNKEKIVKNNEI